MWSILTSHPCPLFYVYYFICILFRIAMHAKHQTHAKFKKTYFTMKQGNSATYGYECASAP